MLAPDARPSMKADFAVRGLGLKVRRQIDGSIDFDFYRRQALRRRTRYLKHVFARHLSRFVAAARWGANLFRCLLAKLAVSVERTGEPYRRQAVTRSVQDRRDVSERIKCEIGPGAYPTYNQMGTVVVASAWLAFFAVGVATAEADAFTIRGMGIDVFQLQQKVKNLPVLKFRDMSLVFPSGE